MLHATVMLRDRVEESLARIRPALQADGGDVELVRIEDGVAIVRFAGACLGCPLSLITLKAGIEERLRSDVPELVAVDSLSHGRDAPCESGVWTRRSGR